MPNQKINSFIIVFEIIIICTAIILLYLVNNYNHNLYKFSNERLLMLQTADRLRQSSDDLTHFARTYVVTADLKFKQQYFDTLDIRNGKKTRPLLYNTIYWDLEKELREKKHPSTQKIALKEIFNSLPYTKAELDKLKLSEANSNKLVNLEIEAFNAMIGLYKDKNASFTIKDKVNQALAIKLLHSKEYYHTKHLIMNPIDDFIIMLDKRTKKQVENIKESRDFYFTIFLGVILLFILGNTFIYRYIKNIEKLEQENLKKQILDAVNKTKKQEQQLLKQEKLAALGEMMDAIAHQWKQPLSIISIYIDTLLVKYASKSSLTKEELMEMSDKSKTQIDHLVSTIDEFRSFFRTNKNLEKENLTKLLDSTLKLLKTELINNKIEVLINQNDELLKDCLTNEFKHIYINLINNAKDAYIQNNIKNRVITFDFINTEDSLIIKCQDHAGGVPENIKNRIFESNFTTKEEGKGTGIGLYLAKQIVEKHNGSIKVENKNNGACFIITFTK